MRKGYIWRVKAKNTPLLKRKCNQCDNDKFYCSEKFRVNAQKKNVDIWLIYRCVNCDGTYNMNLFSRTKPESISKDLFNKFLGNDRNTAWKYAFSHETKQKNKVEFDFESVEYEIENDGFSLGDMLNFDQDILNIQIEYPFDFNLKRSSVVRSCLGLSANKLNQVIEAKIISIQDKHLQKKHKLKNGDVVQINREGLRNLLINF